MAYMVSSNLTFYGFKSHQQYHFYSEKKFNYGSVCPVSEGNGL